MLLQVVPPVPTDLPPELADPGAIKVYLDGLTRGVLDAVSRPLLDAGVQIWQGLAVILVVWRGIKIAFSGTADSWELFGTITAIMLPRAILHFYAVPLPGTALTLPAAITGQGAWVADQLMGNTWSDSFAGLQRYAASIWPSVVDHVANAGLFGAFTAPAAALFQLLMAVLMLASLLIAVVAIAIGFAQVIWAQVAMGIAVVLGPLFVPWLCFAPLAFLFWGWLRLLLTYSLYAAIAAAVYRIFVHLILGVGYGMQSTTAAGGFVDAFAGGLFWLVTLVIADVAAVVAFINIPQLAAGLISGSPGGGGITGALMTVGGSITTAARAVGAARKAVPKGGAGA